MTGAEDVAAEIRRGISGLPVELVDTARGLLREAHEILAATSDNAEMQHAAAAMRHSLDELERLQAVFGVIRSAMEGLVTALMGAGSPPTTTPSPPARPEPTSPNATDRHAAALLVKLPVRGDLHRKTSGYWIDDDGIEHGPIVSGRTNGYREAMDKLRELGIAPSRGELFVAAHVEVKLAVRLRAAGSRAATLIINNDPCFEGDWSCDRLLPQILNPGQQITIHWPEGKKTYQGREG